VSSLVAECTFRPLQPEEVGLLLDSWSKSFRDSPYAGVIRNDQYFGQMKLLIGGLIARGAKVLCAAVGDRVVGWVCYEHKQDSAALHYVYVKGTFRRQGLGRELVHRADLGDRFFYTHRTHYAKHVVPKTAVHVPEVARRRDF
jgi:ribosomal protein S18 acetylase RimI-like enzyme